MQTVSKMPLKKYSEQGQTGYNTSCMPKAKNVTRENTNPTQDIKQECMETRKYECMAQNSHTDGWQNAKHSKVHVV